MALVWAAHENIHTFLNNLEVLLGNWGLASANHAESGLSFLEFAGNSSSFQSYFYHFIPWSSSLELAAGTCTPGPPGKGSTSSLLASQWNSQCSIRGAVYKSQQFLKCLVS